MFHYFALQERRKERDKDNMRQKESIRQMEESLKARERIYKERIKGLEGQTEVLKEQLSKEMRRRQVFISGKQIQRSVINYPHFQTQKLTSTGHYFHLKLIHEADPQSPPVVIIVFARLSSVLLSVRPSPLFKTKQISEWIIDDTCLVRLILRDFTKSVL